MINKQNLWFVTLFSLILVLGIYYVTLGDENLIVDNIVDNSSPVISVEDSDVLLALKVAEDEAVMEKIASYEAILLDNTASLEEKNDAYDNLQEINTMKTKAEDIEKILKETYELESFVKILSDQINVTIAGDKHDSTLANNIIRTIQNMYDKQMYITVKFQG